MKLFVSVAVELFANDRASCQHVLLIDGYNVIGAWSELKHLQLDEARNKLVHIVAEYQIYSGYNIQLVFDAYRVPGRGVNYVQHNLSIHFTKEKETADECIVRLVKELQHHDSQIYVVTSDMMEQNIAFAYGALRISAREFHLLIRQSQQEIKEKIHHVETQLMKRNPVAEKLSLEQWIKLERMRCGEDN